MQIRLRELGFSLLGASKLGILSRSTLTSLRDADRVPNLQTLTKLDDLLVWEPGSAKAVLYGRDPVPREHGVYSHLPKSNLPEEEARTGVTLDTLFNPNEDPAQWDYNALVSAIERRLRELNMTKSKFAAIGGPGRSTLATLGRRGYVPTAETLDRIDRFLMWERGSALTVLRGGAPVRIGAAVAHPALVPLNAVRDTLKAVKIRLNRQAQSVAQLQSDVDEALTRVNVAIAEVGDPARRAVLDPDSGSPDEGDAAGKGEIHD
ncbi:hypothetical protein [Mycobacterium sp. IDR2000157661]|uniref:hypothetical protein n=1 Tax=Mycobacterium sp. IDR2000157661 TaxID=2867005 RepID=UPI001EEB3320|nr:hypothetical protein [Mycobacterium sp. IDR2000157661]